MITQPFEKISQLVIIAEASGSDVGYRLKTRSFQLG
jgi:hypothetical protein